MSEDPLFEALVKHITGPNHSSDEELLRILNDPRNARKPILSSSMVAESAFDDEGSTADLGSKDIQSLFYVNILPDSSQLSSSDQGDIKKSKERIDFNNKFFAATCERTVQQKIDGGMLTSSDAISDQVKRSTYRAKVAQHLTSRSPWLAPYATKMKRENFDIPKSDFHSKLLSIMLDGLEVPSSAYNNFEPVLVALSKSISQLSSSDEKSLMINVMIARITAQKAGDWPPQKDAPVRLISFRTGDRLIDYVAKKETAANVSFDLEYLQDDFVFKKDVFGKVEDHIRQNVEGGAGTAAINKYDLVV